jgi:hypothetical protein
LETDSEREKPIKWSETKLILLQANKQESEREEVEKFSAQ